MIFDMRELHRIVDSKKIIQYTKMNLVDANLSSIMEDCLINVGVPKNISISTSFKTPEKGGFKQLASIDNLFVNIEIDNIDISHSILIAEYNNTLIIKPNKSDIILNYDFERNDITYVNQNIESYFACLLILNTAIFEITEKHPNEFFAKYMTDELIDKLFMEMISVDDTVDNDTYWDYLFGTIEEMRDEEM